MASSLRAKLILMAAQSVIVPLVSSITGKIGEAVGDIIAYHINPPTEPDTEEDPAPTPDPVEAEA